MLRLGFVSSGGVVLRWFRDTFAQSEVAQAAAEGKDVYDILLDDIPMRQVLLCYFHTSQVLELRTLTWDQKGQLSG